MNLNSPSLGVAEERLRVDEDALAPVLGGADGDELALAHAPPSRGPTARHRFASIEDAVHARLARHVPLALDANVRRQIRRREEAFGKHAVGGRGNEARVGGASEARRRQVRMEKCGHA